MKTFLKVAAVVFILMLALPFMLQLRMISPEEGSIELLYLPLNGYGSGGSVGVDLREELQAVYGEEGVPVETAGYREGAAVIVTDAHEYELEYVGEALNGKEEYLKCTVVTSRTVRDTISGEKIGSGIRISNAFACNEFGNEKRAYVLWETLKEEFYGSGFDVESAY